MIAVVVVVLFFLPPPKKGLGSGSVFTRSRKSCQIHANTRVHTQESHKGRHSSLNMARSNDIMTRWKGMKKKKNTNEFYLYFFVFVFLASFVTFESWPRQCGSAWSSWAEAGCGHLWWSPSVGASRQGKILEFFSFTFYFTLFDICFDKDWRPSWEASFWPWPLYSPPSPSNFTKSSSGNSLYSFSACIKNSHL